jgi:hypothetical protein
VKDLSHRQAMTEAVCVINQHGCGPSLALGMTECAILLCHSERSRGISQFKLLVVRDVSTALDMTRSRFASTPFTSQWATCPLAPQGPSSPRASPSEVRTGLALEACATATRLASGVGRFLDRFPTDGDRPEKHCDCRPLLLRAAIASSFSRCRRRG